MRVPDAFQGAVAQGEIEFVNEAAGAEGGQLAAEFNDPLFNLGGGLMELMVRSARMLLQAF